MSFYTNKSLFVVCTLTFLFACQDAKFAGDPFKPSKVTQKSLPESMVKERINKQKAATSALSIPQEKVILFGDTHVHSTYSLDAFQWSLPIMHGAEGAFPPADACD